MSSTICEELGELKLSVSLVVCLVLELLEKYLMTTLVVKVAYLNIEIYNGDKTLSRQKE